jgi:predicted XRE-type DNA-binding protein
MKSHGKKPKGADVVRKSGHVFAQLGRPDADDLIRRARVVQVINDAIVRHGLTQTAAAELAGIDQADVSRLANGRVGRFSLDRLMTIVDRLGIDVAIEQRRDAHGRLTVDVRELGRSRPHPRTAATETTNGPRRRLASA